LIVSLFESMLDEFAEWRHADIWRRLPRPSRPHHDPLDGFLPFEKAAAVMGVTVSEAIDMGMRGALEIDIDRKLIRPAIVSTLGVEVVQ